MLFVFLRLIISLLLIGFSFDTAMASVNCREIYKMKVSEVAEIAELAAARALRARKKDQSEAFTPLVEAFAEIVRSTRDAEIEQIVLDISQNIHIARYPDRVHRETESQITENIVSPNAISKAGLPELLYKILYFNGTNNGPSARLAEGHRYEAEFFLWTSHFLEISRSSQFDYLVTPIGKMEPQVYYDLLVTTGVLMHILHKNSARLEPLIREIDQSEVDFFRRHQTISIPSTGGTSRYHPTFWALQEGILSLHQLMVMMHAEGVAPLNPAGLVNSLTTLNGGRTPLNHITRALPMAVVGPFAMRGHFLEQPLRRSERGHLVPTEVFKNYVLNLREDFRPDVLENGINGPVSCLGCPVTSAPEGRPTGVDQLSSSFQNIFNRIQE